MWQVFKATLDELMAPAMQLIEENFAYFEDAGRAFPFGITRDEIMGIATTHFSRRVEVIQAAVGKGLEEIERSREEEELEEELAIS